MDEALIQALLGWGVLWALDCWMHMEHPGGTMVIQSHCPGQQLWRLECPTPSDLPKKEGSLGDRVVLGIPGSQDPDFCCPPAGTGPIHLNEVQCRGTEKSLWNCPFRNITQEDCKHSEDAAVRCNIPYMGYENLVRTTGGC